MKQRFQLLNHYNSLIKVYNETESIMHMGSLQAFFSKPFHPSMRWPEF